MRRYETFNPEIPEDADKAEKADVAELPVYDLTGTKKREDGEVKQQLKNKNKKGGKSKEKREKTPGSSSKVVGFFTSKTLRWIVGLFLAFFAIYVGIAFISYFSTCINDQSEIHNTAIGSSGKISNAAGEGGARLSDFLINEFFGVGSFVLIIWMLAIGMRLVTGKPRFKIVNFTIKCIVALITISLIVGLLTIGMETSVNWGGYHGRYVNEFIIHFLGWSGAFILCLFMICCFVLICMRDVVKWGLKQREKYLEKRRIKREEREAELAKEMELKEMRRQEDQVGNADIIDSSDKTADDEVEEEETEASKQTLELRFDDVDKYSESSEEEEERREDPRYEYVYSAENDHQQGGTDVEKSLQEETQGNDFDSYTLSEFSSNEANHGGETGSSQERLSTDENYVISGSNEKTGENSGGDIELNMVVNVNTISETKGKSQGIGNDSPEHFPYKFPSFELLLPGKEQILVDEEEQIANKERIRKTLLDFDIPIVSIEATIGPTVTLYEIVPDKGIRVSKIRSLVDDIALSLSADGIRIIAPIPGKGTVGIEVANKVKQTVSMRTVLKSPNFQSTKYKLPIALGSTISNEVYMADLAKMPHLLVAGATGQGKSVGLNAIITSLLYSKRPDELKFVMIDPKMVEFSLYAKIEGHYLAKIPDAEDAVITDMDKVVATLNSLCIEMDNRYQLMKEAATKNIIEYNDKIKEKKLNPNEGHKFMPYIVVIVDEFSDLIMTAGKEVEIPIARLAQKARAVGMHVIVATQRPSTNVITGIIKANFPARIAFKVSSGIDSKTILDTTGAQQLIGRGDMLVSNSAPMERVQCAFVDTPEVEKIAEHIASQPYQQGAYILPEPTTGKGDGDYEGGGVGSLQERDPLFEEVARLVVQSNTASTSSVQRRYSIGYNRAGKIMDQLEAAGIVGPAQGGKARSVLVDPISLESILSN
ncbi:MAG: DNA translocase FtsK [Muribaculaceae bacterium]|nr:DNA translocase FtsK [Muribaculaceae bacterium]